MHPLYIISKKSDQKKAIMHLWLKTDFLISMHAIVYTSTQSHQFLFKLPSFAQKQISKTNYFLCLLGYFLIKKRSMHFFKKAVLSRLCKRLLSLWISVAIFWGQKKMHFWLMLLSMEFIAWFLKNINHELGYFVNQIGGKKFTEKELGYSIFPTKLLLCYLYIIHGKTKANSISQSVFPKGLVKKDVKVNLS